MQRRDVILGGMACVAVGSAPAEASPLLVPLLRFLFSIGGRLAVRGAARSAVGGAARLAARRSIAIANSRIVKSGAQFAAAAISFRSERLQHQFDYHEPDVLLIQQEPADVFIVAPSEFSTTIVCNVSDYETGVVEYKESIYASGDAGRPSPFRLHNLPFSGIKRLQGIPEGSSEFFSEKFMVVSRDDINIENG